VEACGCVRHHGSDVAVGDGQTCAVVSVAGGKRQSCALTTVGGVKCWGDNTYGQLLGDGTTNDTTIPTTVIGLG